VLYLYDLYDARDLALILSKTRLCVFSLYRFDRHAGGRCSIGCDVHDV